jgi:capsular exopolysaccharide synthesis family protein
MAATSLTPSAMAEAFRSTMTSLLLSGEGGDPPKVLVFTSASPGEGKTTVVSNLAISLAQINQRVLLIDADMRLPRAHLIFDAPNNFGLSDVLNERKPIEEYLDESLVRKTHIPNLFILPAGPARTNLSRLFHSTRMNELLARFRDMFDVVLIDTAPVLVVPDSRILARRADAVVLVVRAHQTHQAAAFAASNRFASDGTRVLGTILNDWDPRSATHSYGGYYGKKGYSYYSEK